MSNSNASSGRLSDSCSLLKAVTLLLVLPLLWANDAWSAECAQTNYTLTTQAEVDALGATGCDRVLGFVVVAGSQFYNLDGLANLTRVDGDLVIEGYGGANIDGLKSLTSVGGDLRIWFNPTIANFDGLANLTSVGGNLRISLNESLTNLNGLANLTSVGGFVYISTNEKLTNLDGLAKITNVVGSKSRFVSRGLSILDNRLLTDLDGLANITSVERDLDIENNDSLTNCRGLAMVLGWPNGPPDDAVGGNISLKDNGVGCNSIDEILASVSEPTAPAITSTTSGNGRIRLTVSVSENGGANITRYDASCTDGTSVYTGTSATSSIIVSGLTNDVAYTCTVTATNSVGTSSASAVTDPIALFDDTPEAFVERHYVNALGRPSDAAGLAAWVNVMRTQSASAVPNGILLSAEFKDRGLDDAAFVNTLYKTFFDRDGSSGEINSWVAQLSQGRLREMVMWDVVRSAEFKRLAFVLGVVAVSPAHEAVYGIRAFTERFYTVVLVRYPDSAGFNGWVAALTDGSYSGSDIARGFFLSPEYVSQNKSDSLFLDDCYQAYFDRAADPGGKQGWLDLIAQGMSREQVLAGFSGSQEFIALAESYGIRPFAGYVSARVARETDGIPIPVFPIPLSMLLAGLLCLLGFRKLRSV